MRPAVRALALLLLSAGQARAQVSEQELPRLRDAVASITSRALTERRTYAALEELCRVAPRRLAGSPAAAAAVTWARQTMTAAGLERVRLEPCAVPRWVRGAAEELRVVAPAAAAGEPLRVLALGGSAPTPPEGLTGELLEVRSLAELEQRAEQARGKVVFFNRPLAGDRLDPFAAYGEAVDQRARGPAAAARAGALASIVRSMTPDLDDVPHTGNMRQPDDAPPAPAVAVSTRGAERIASLLTQGPVTVHLRLSCATLEDEPSFNVVGELRGRERPEEVVLLGAHLDSWDVGQGAHDDGAGCCQVIEALRLLRSLGLRARRTLRAVLFMNEENGLRGALAYAEAHAEEGPLHVLALESDRGGFAPRGFTTDAAPAAREILAALVRLLEPLGAERLLPGSGGADIGPLRRFGVVQVGYLPDAARYFGLHHTERDTFEQVSWRELELGTAAIAALGYMVADLPERLPANPVEPPAERR